LLAQDDYYFPRDSNHLEYIDALESYNFDTIRAIDMDKFHADVKKLIDSKQYDYIFLDGFLLFDDEKLSNLLDKKYFFYLNKDVCWMRRQARNYDYADSIAYFDGCVWPEYLKYKQKCENKYDDVVFINGSDLLENVLNFVIGDLKGLK
jgi:nicotinamide/nicotinate riboside kinase